MNIKPNLALIVITILLVAAGCSPFKSSSSVLDPAQPATRNDKVLPMTGVQAPNTAQDLETYPSQQLHSECISEDSQRQVNCVDKEPAQSTALTLHTHKNDIRIRASSSTVIVRPKTANGRIVARHKNRRPSIRQAVFTNGRIFSSQWVIRSGAST